MLGFEVSPIVQYVVAFAIIAILLALFAIVLKRIGGNRFAMSGGERGRGRQPRLGIVDVYDLDRQRQLVLLRRDNVEHLVMLGGANDFVVESNIVRMPASRAMAPQAHMQPGQAPHGAAPVAGPEAGHDRAPIPEVGPAPQPVMPAQPFPPQTPASLQGVPERDYPAQGASQAAPDVAPDISPARPTPQPHQPVPGAAIAPTGHTAEDRGAPAGGEPVPPVTPRQDMSRSGPRPEESPQPQKRGLFGFARPGGQKPGGQENDKPDDRRDAPQFPPRSRATPVAPPTPSPYPPRRTSETAQPAADVTAGLDAALAAGGGVAAAAAARPGSGEAAAAVSVTPQEMPKTPSEEGAGSQEAARSTPDLQQALLSDMERELEAAFQRQATAPPPPEAPAQPDAQPPPETPAFPTRMAPAVPQPVMSAPVETDMPADEAPAVADAARLMHPHVPEPGMTPPPSAGPAYFAPIVDEAIPPQEERQEEWQEIRQEIRQEVPQEVPEEVPQDAPEEEPRDPGIPGEYAHAPEAGMATTAAADEAPTGETAEEEAFGKVIGADETASAPAALEEPTLEGPPLEKPDVEEPRFETPSAEVPSQGGTASEEALRDHGPPAPDTVPAQDPAEEAPAPVSGEAVQESGEESGEESDEEPREKPRQEDVEEPPQVPDEPKAKVDPFSVDEIEAEFARLLGRSVDKDPKSS